ncbi:DNA primase [Brachyspira pilosicoli]|mgnify:FL=1|uniref:DNA primase n=2 Tax=Brachyspira pilosicoli TaxID=52584 RepID=A0AAJ6GB93_BRAPL|nr:DNA primase [Brachyspira pilosicoli]AFR71118.1 DNA primase [Brachyspira pilosicoli B2904]MBW5378911.1 DNA primase [Brachyspira pilosicoli]MBW5382225.1 DNA primase [Brachyspira pilosicoli]MBW5391744.1 DNA primase [Brachyspira pilosicoli]WIH82224.1 DNA primase [Brachyspira pilosicoli]
MDTLFTEKLNQLLSNVSLIDILRDRYKVISRGGSQYTVQCPFHKDGQEANPSMSVDDSKGIYKCFTCGAKGNVFTYLKEKEAMDFKEAVKYLGNRFSIDTSNFFSQKNKHKDQVFVESKRINKIACNFFGKNLLLKNNNGEYFYKEAIDYLKKRKIPFSIIKEFKIGYAPPSWNALIKALNENNISTNNINALGLASISKNNPNHFYDTFINRIMFPIINEKEEIIGFGGRSIDGKEPKYLNSKESLIFKKKSALYGINIAKTHIMKKDEVILVEGYMDTIACHKMNIKNVVGSLGTAITEEHAKEIKKYTNNVVLALDNDEAGQKATKMAILTLLKFDLKLTILLIETTKDLDEFFTINNANGFDILYNKKLAWYDFLLKTSTNKDIALLTIEEKLYIVKLFYNYLDVLKSETEKQMIISHISSELSIDRDAFNRDYLRTLTNKVQNTKVVSALQKPIKDNKFYYENSLIYLLALNPSLIKEAEKEIGVDLIKKDITREFYIRLLTLNKDATAEDALNVLGNEHIANQIRSKEKLYTDNIQEKLEELIVKIKSGDIDYRREEVLKTTTLQSNEGFEAICNKAREIHLLNKQKEKLYQGSDYDD